MDIQLTNTVAHIMIMLYIFVCIIYSFHYFRRTERNTKPKNTKKKHLFIKRDERNLQANYNKVTCLAKLYLVGVDTRSKQRIGLEETRKTLQGMQETSTLNA